MHKEPKAKFTISRTKVRIGSGLFFATIIAWLGYSLQKDDLALILPKTKYQWEVAHFHGLVAWFLSGSVLCFAACLVSCAAIPMNQVLHRWTRNFAWVFFVVGLIVVPIWTTHGKNLPSLSDFLFGYLLVVGSIVFVLTLLTSWLQPFLTIGICLPNITRHRFVHLATHILICIFTPVAKELFSLMPVYIFTKYLLRAPVIRHFYCRGRA